MTKSLFLAGFTILLSSLTLSHVHANDNNSISKNISNTISDSSITTAIKTKYMADDLIKSLDIHVETKEGKVTLNTSKGKAVTQDVKERAISIAKSTNGVKEVNAANIEVSAN